VSKSVNHKKVIKSFDLNCDNKNTNTNSNYRKKLYSSSSSDSSSSSSIIPKTKTTAANLLNKKTYSQKPIMNNSGNNAPNTKKQYIESNSHFESEEEQILVKKKTNNVKIPQKNENTAYAFNKTKTENKPTTNYFSSVSVNEKFLNQEKLKETFDLIPTYNLEDVSFLKNNYLTLFEKGTLVVFRVYELSMDNVGPIPSTYKKGRIEEFIEDTKYFLIKIDDLDENLTMMYSNYDTEDGSCIISVHLRDFIELWIEKSSRNNPIIPSEAQNQGVNTILNINDTVTNSTSGNKIVNKSQSNNNSNANDNKNKRNLFTNIVLSQIKKQVEYYFGDKNYYKDSFLLEKAALNEEHCNNYLNII
jgi:hypothetical protein